MSLLRTATCVLLALARAAAAEPLPGTQLLSAEGDLASQMVDGIDRFLLRETAESIARRPRLDRPAIAREHLAKMIGVDERRADKAALQIVSAPGRPQVIARGAGFDVFEVRWPVLSGVDGEGLLLVPTGGDPVAHVIAIPDADQTPEMLVGLENGVAEESQFARRFAESGCRVLVPTLINRRDTFSISRSGQATNQPGREWVYRPAFEMGRHVIGYEVQKIRSAALWMRGREDAERRVGVIGYGEGRPARAECRRTGIPFRRGLRQRLFRAARRALAGADLP